MILDGILRDATGDDVRIDVGGEIAAKGTVHEKSLAAWLDHPFLANPDRRSTGREEFGRGWLADHEEELKNMTLEDRLATASHWIAECVAIACRDRVDSETKFLVGGGGAHHRCVLNALATRLPCTPEKLDGNRHGVSADLREAAAFAILGHERVRGRSGSFPSTTGCSRAGPVGAIWLPSCRCEAHLEEIVLIRERGGALCRF